MRKLDYDFLIIGTGLAGLYAANYASQFGRVGLFTKSHLQASSSYWAQGGIAAALDPDDSTLFHLEDTVAAGRGLCSTDAVRVLVDEGRQRVLDLIEQGLKFDQGLGGFELGLEGGHSHRRVLHAGGSATGKRMVEFLISAVASRDNIDVIEGTGLLEIASDGTRCRGGVFVNEDMGEVTVVSAPATILAIGGASALYTRTTNPPSATGDGIAVAWRAGVEVADMEFTQFHPTALFIEGKESFLITEALRGEGAHLVNGKGERFMLDKDKRAELAPRDIVARVIHNEISGSGEDCVYMSLAHMDPGFIKKRFGNIYARCLEHGIDITTELVPIAPAAHYTIGGVRTDLSAQSSIKGLFACGEVSCTGVHGANRLASNSLLECVVFAKRAVDGALGPSIDPPGSPAEWTGEVDISPAPDGGYGGFLELKAALSAIMDARVGIVRDADGLARGLEEIEEMSAKVGSDPAIPWLLRHKFANMSMVCTLMARAALLREESRGGHMRADYPSEDEAWRTHIIMRKDGETRFERP